MTSLQEWLEKGGDRPKPEKKKPVWLFWLEVLLLIALVIGIGYFGIMAVTWLGHMIAP